MQIRVEKLTAAEIDQRRIFKWPIWEKEPSTFDWHYDEHEQCLFLEGEVEVTTPDGKVKIQKGDFVTFPQGLSCTWHVLRKVKKHYQFGG